MRPLSLGYVDELSSVTPFPHISFSTNGSVVFATISTQHLIKSINIVEDLLHNYNLCTLTSFLTLRSRFRLHSTKVVVVR